MRSDFRFCGTRRLCVLIVVCFVFVICAFESLSAQNRNYNVKLWIYEFEDSVVYVRGAYGERTDILLDSLTLQSDGGFILKGNFHPGIVVVSSVKEDMFSFVLDKETDFEVSIFPDGFYEVKGSIENDRYLEYQKMNREYRLVLYQAELALKEDPQKKDSLNSVVQKAKNTFDTYRNSFHELYPDNMMSVLVRAVSQPEVPKHYLNSDGSVKKETALEYAYYFRTHYWDDFDFSDERILGTPYFYKKFQTYIDKITMQNADSVFVSFKSFIDLANSRKGESYSRYIMELYLTKLPRLPFSFNEILYTRIVDEMINDDYTPWLSLSEREAHQSYIEQIRPFLPGKAFPNISAQTLDGRELSLYNLKHRYTIVFFWSAGCESCKKNAEELREFYNSSKDKYDFEVFSIEMGGDRDKTQKQTSEEGLEWFVLQANPAQIESRYGLNVEHTPEIYILDSNKRVLNKTVLSSHIKAVIEQEEKFSPNSRKEK